MQPILYWFPVASVDDDSEEKTIIRKSGRIIPYQLDEEPYEVDVETMGASFRLIFGSKINGRFLCIPNWALGCELSDLEDHRWNIESILRTERLDYDECNAIAWALSSIGKLLKILHH